MSALGLTYEDYVAINGGDHCGICGRGRSATRKLDRDHEHAKDGTGRKLARGLLCPRCNRQLPSWVTVRWLEQAIEYLVRYERRTHGSDSVVDGGRADH